MLWNSETQSESSQSCDTKEIVVPLLTRRALYGRIVAVLYCRTENTSILFLMFLSRKERNDQFWDKKKSWKRFRSLVYDLFVSWSPTWWLNDIINSRNISQAFTRFVHYQYEPQVALDFKLLGYRANVKLKFHCRLSLKVERYVRKVNYYRHTSLASYLNTRKHSFRTMPRKIHECPEICKLVPFDIFSYWYNGKHLTLIILQ